MTMQLTQIMTITLIILVAFCICGSGFCFYKAFRIKKNGPKWLKRGGWFLLATIVFCLAIRSFSPSKQEIIDTINNIVK